MGPRTQPFELAAADRGGMAAANATAEGAAIGSPGVLSDNVVQVPIHIPVNVCGTPSTSSASSTPALGKPCVNGGGLKDHYKGQQHGEYDEHQTRDPAHFAPSPQSAV
ncbi:chaplin [Streptomyces sp. A1136]|uniref:chaplin n=1 Tax=Streptomyces sp. A1136 TaxID=2563102 RepID=UPI0023F04579|nr:chaplin [Streptomyces sp. A1136]